MSLCTGAFLGDITGGSVYDLAGFRWCCSIEGFVVGGLVNKYILVYWEPEYSGIGRRLEDVSYTWYPVIYKVRRHILHSVKHFHFQRILIPF